MSQIYLCHCKFLFIYHLFIYYIFIYHSSIIYPSIYTLSVFYLSFYLSIYRSSIDRSFDLYISLSYLFAIYQYTFYSCVSNTWTSICHQASNLQSKLLLIILHHPNEESPSVGCEFILLPLVKIEAALVYSRTEQNKVGK